MELADITSALIDWAVRIGQSVNDLPGTVAFGLGLFTWFMVEQLLRRILSWMRWVVVIGVLAGLGLSLPYLAGLAFERGGTPEIGFPTGSEDGFTPFPME